MSLQDELDITPLKKALETLKKGVSFYKNGLNLYNEEMIEGLIDMCIQRFEYTLESSIKFMRKILIKEYNQSNGVLTMTNTFRFMQDYGFIKNWENWDNYYKNRNKSVHEYSFEKSRSAFDIIPNFIEDVDYLIKNIEERLK